MENYWFNAKTVVEKGSVFNIIIGGRGIGKTYSSLKMLVESNVKFIFLRRSEEELNVIATEEANPFKILNKDMGWNITIKGKKIKHFYNEDKSIGYLLALSTFKNLRGFDFSDVKFILWDEFIEQIGCRTFIRNEAATFFHLYETVNRNRELQGQPPVQVLFLGNSDSLNNDLLRELNLVDVIEKLILKSQVNWCDPERSIRIMLPSDNPVSIDKNDTALYRLTKGNSFSKLSLGNEFIYESWYNVQTEKIIEYRILGCYENVYIYRHKTLDKYYMSFTPASCFKFTKDNITQFKRNFYFELHEANARGVVFYESLTVKKIIESVI